MDDSKNMLNNTMNLGHKRDGPNSIGHKKHKSMPNNSGNQRFNESINVSDG